MFKDITKIVIRSGRGGNGHVSFRREKYVPNGGPDGGDGGKGGDVIFVTDSSLNTLGHFNYNKKYSATNGQEGGKRRCHGKDGQDIILKVPEGTIIREAKTNKIIMDMSATDGKYIILKGGKGGLGNMHFATSVMQTPKYAKPGEEAKELEIVLELKLIADVGLVGLPNAGKSSFLARVTNATPKIADYPFTTLNPHLGMANIGLGQGFLIADIPGIIKGASDGIGLGHDFLKHIERNRVLLHLVDISSKDIDIIKDNIDSIIDELNKFSDSFANKPMIIALNKVDTMVIDEANSILSTLEKIYPQFEMHLISTVSGYGIDQLLNRIYLILQNQAEKETVFDSEYNLNKHYSNEYENSDYKIEKKYEKGEVKYIVTGDKIDKMLGYTNLESDKGFNFFQNFIKDSGIEAGLIEMNIEDGDTVNVGGMEFEFFR